jgi:hypothetical protein
MRQIDAGALAVRHHRMNGNRAEILKAVIAFVAEQQSCDPKALDANSELLRDVRLYGDDVEPFFLDFAARFGVDISGLGAVGPHFPGEGWDGFTTIFKWLTRQPIEEQRFIPIILDDMVDAVMSGKWPTP